MLRINAFRLLALAACLSLITTASRAEQDLAVALASHECGAACCGDTCCDNDCCCDDGCGCYGCVSSVEKEKVKKHCWKVECKHICVPKVVAPWADGGSGLTCFNWLKKKGSAGCGDACCGDACCGDACCGDACCEDACCCCLKPRCGEVKCVRELKKEKYETEKCVCKWEIRRLPPCCDSGYGCCDGGQGCCDSVCPTGCGH